MQKLPRAQNISQNFVERTLKNHNLSKPHKRKSKGGSVYLIYPKYWLASFDTLLQIDFIGPRYLYGSGEPYHFLSCKYVQPFKLNLFFRIKAPTSTSVLNTLHCLFRQYPIPSVVQMDNDSAFRGCIERKRSVGRVIRWLCSLGIIPIFNAPNSPWNNGSVEGGNSVFDRKPWQKFNFSSVDEIDQKLKEFNQAYETYLIPNYQDFLNHKIPLTNPLKFKAKDLKIFPQTILYLLRTVQERYGKYQVEILNIYLNLPAKLKGQYVIIELDLIGKTVKIYQEIEKTLILIYQNSFDIYI